MKALQILAGHLTYDSAGDLQPAGARANRSDSRQVLYEAGDFCLDLRFDRERDSMQIMLVGQVANQKNPQISGGADCPCSFCPARKSSLKPPVTNLASSHSSTSPDRTCACAFR